MAENDDTHTWCGKHQYCVKTVGIDLNGVVRCSKRLRAHVEICICVCRERGGTTCADQYVLSRV